MKHLKLFESFDESSIGDIKSLFLELEDNNFVVDISQSKSIDFMGNKEEYNSYGTYFHEITKNEKSAKDIILVTIRKMIPKDQFKGSSIQARHLHDDMIPTQFYLNEISEVLLFVESYSKDEMDLKMKWIFDGSRYYRSVKNIPQNKISEVIIGFA